jgi:sugar phosphate isomerase/epimerase
MMRLSCLTLSFQNQFKQGKMDIFKFIQQCRALNFDRDRPAHEYLGGTGKDHLKKVRRLALDSGLSIASMCVSTEFGRDAAAVPAQIDKAREAMEVGMMLGAPVLRVFVGSPPSPDKTEEAFQRGADALRKCAEYGAEMGMPVALQNHSGLTSTGDDMLKFYKTVNHPNFTLLLDTATSPAATVPTVLRSLVIPTITTIGSIEQVATLTQFRARQTLPARRSGRREVYRLQACL